MAYTKEELLELHDEIAGEARRTMEKKNEDYSAADDALANFKAYQKLGACSTEIGIITRIIDKVVRVTNLAKNGSRSVEDETFADTIEDLINYSILLECAHRDDDEVGGVDLSGFDK